MTDEPKDGGPVHPTLSHGACIPGEGCRVHPGLSLRDYFAAQAMQGWMMATFDEPRMGMPANAAKLVARQAYELADLMLEERSKT